jgi:hypothetical protein
MKVEDENESKKVEQDSQELSSSEQSTRFQTAQSGHRELVEEEKLDVIYEVERAAYAFLNILKPLVVVKGGKVESTGSVFPDFESPFVNMAILNLYKVRGYTRLLMEYFEASDFPDPISYGDQISLQNLFGDSGADLFDAMQASETGDTRIRVAEILSFIAKAFTNKIVTLDLSYYGREAAVYRTNLFNIFCELEFLLKFEWERADRYNSFLALQNNPEGHVPGHFSENEEQDIPEIGI